MIKPKYNGVVLLVENVEKSRKFYTEILEQEIEMDFGRCVGFVGGFTLWDSAYAFEMMELHGSLEKLAGERIVELYFEVLDLDTFNDRIKLNYNNIVHDIKEQPWGQRCFRIYDPDRYIVEFAEPMSMVIQRFYNQGFTVDEIVTKTMMLRDMVNSVLNP
jgi:catechol 2,3-dioxygenase-like lactoylglutathione lyase family enzyme